MDWSQAPRILLIWPETGKVLRSQLDLILLERYASSIGSQLAITTSDNKVIYQSEEAGIPVFRTRREAQLQPWRKSSREFQRQELEKYASESLPAEPLERQTSQPRVKYPLWVRIPIFTLGVLSVLVLAAFLLPSAEVVIQPAIRQQELSISIQAQPGREQITLSGLIPARELMVTVEGQLSTPSTGTEPIPGEYAQGEVIFTNLGEESVSIPPNTILSTPGEKPILFRTLTAGNTPPEQGGQIKVAIEAYLPGESGNISANQISKINLEVGAELIVTNPLPTEGGTDILVPAPTQFNRLSLSRKMTRDLEDKALEEIGSILGSGDFLLTEDLSVFKVIEEIYTPQEGTPGEILWLDKSVTYLIYYISGDDLRSLVTDLIKTQYRDNTYQVDLDSIQLNPVSFLERQGEDYILEFQVSWTDSRIVQQAEVNDWILGKALDDAERILLRNLDLEGSPQIRVQPSWWPRIPAFPFRIQIIQGEV
jgi:hypothetical protein